MNPESTSATLPSSAQQQLTSPPVPPATERLLALAGFRSMVFSGSLVMLIGTVFVSLSNFGYNVAMARMLGPALFGHVSAVATLLMLLSAFSLSFQLVGAKFIARNESTAGKREVYASLMRKAWLFGLGIALAIALGSPVIASLLRLPSPLLIVVLAIGFGFSIPLGVKRGGLQGLCSFRMLSMNFVTEAFVKLTLALLLVGMGHEVYGAVGAISASVMAAFILTPVRFSPGAPHERAEVIPASFSEGMQAIVFFVGQVVINNIDILLVKSFFPANEAGLYAAVALFGRLLYFACWSIVSAMFPISAANRDRDREHHVLRTTLLLVIAISAVFIGTLQLLPDFVIGLVLGKSFAGISGLLSLYGFATALYSIAVVLMAYEMSQRIANTGWLQLLFSGLLVLAIGAFHHDLKQVIVVQIIMMSMLLIAVSAPFLRDIYRANIITMPAIAFPSGIRRLRPVSENEVIAEFLRNEFHEPDYHRDRNRYEQIVMHPDLSDRRENALRRALLFRRRGHMWRELPPDTQWWQVELGPEDAKLIHVFPRAQWRKISNGSFCISDVVERIRERGHLDGGDRVISKIQQMRYRLVNQTQPLSTVLLIGIDEQHPLTILEGNHRLTAAMLAGPQMLGSRFHVVCGFSPRMGECCWYETNLTNLWRYAKRRLVNLYDREADLRRIPPTKRVEPVLATNLQDSNS